MDKKEKHTIKFEIDYDKLAEAIVKANEKAKNAQKNNNMNEKQYSFWQIMMQIERSKKNNKIKLSVNMFSQIIKSILKSFCSTSFIIFISIAYIIFAIMTWSKRTFYGNIVFIELALMISLGYWIFSNITYAFFEGVQQNDCYDYIMTLFSILINMLAIIIAFISIPLLTIY